jgi:octanoyl-[GcvH]:protein N-octanoyltransferase
MLLHLGSFGGDEAFELSIAHALLRRASAGELDEALRIYRPPAPAAVFGRRDTLLPGFPAASSAAQELGFRTFVRPTGGRAVAYTQQAVVVDHVSREADSAFGTDTRFRRNGAMLAEALHRLGIDARVGAVPGEYCPGAHTVNARGQVKLVGTAQRCVRDAWLFSSLIVVDDRQRIGQALDAIYRHLGLAFDAASVGAVADEKPGLTVEDVERSVLDAHAVDTSTATELQPATVAVALALARQHSL